MIKPHLIYIGAIVSLAGALWYAIDQNIKTSAVVAEQQANLEDLNGKLDTARTNAEETRKRNERLRQTLLAMEQTRDRLQGALNEEEARRAQLEAENREYREWANTRLPDAVIRLLNDTALAPGSGGGHLQRSGRTGPAGNTPGPPVRDVEPGPAAVD